MWIVLDQFSRTLIDAAVANAILLSVVVVVLVFTRQPARRIVLAQTGVYAALVMIPLVAFDLLPRVYPVDWLLSTGLVPPPLTPELNPLDVLQPTAPGVAGRLRPQSRPAASDVEWPAGERLVRVGTLLYLACTAIGVAWTCLGLWGFRRMVARSVEPSRRIRDVFEQLIVDLGRSPPRPALRVSDWLRSPALGGVVRPTIVIPAELDRDDLDRDAIRLILLHELAHADRGDTWFNALAGLAQICWFFLPHLWWLRGQMRIDQEFLADRMAAGPLGESTHYARWLIGLASGKAHRSAPLPAPEDPAEESPRSWGERGFNTPLLQRVAMLLYCPFVVEPRSPRWFSVVVAASFMLVALFLSSFRLLAPVNPAALMHQDRARDPLVRSFQVPEFVVVPSHQGPDPANPPYVLPLALPSAFRLEAEIMANRHTLAGLRIAGCPLVPDPLASRNSPADAPKEPHLFVLRRGFRSLTASLDEEEFDLDPKLLDNVHWLTITPADETATIRDMVITW